MSVIHVLDLPQLYTKPSAESLLSTLALLTTAPPSWDNHPIETVDGGRYEEDEEWSDKHLTVQINPEGVARYLTSIISNSLGWIHDDAVKEEIWNQASTRLSERSGRSAMGAISRKFRIPSPNGTFELSIHEPALTGDDLGLKTWAASYLLAKRLHTFDILQGERGTAKVLELGSGTGLVGLAMASLGADVVLTDLPSIAPNLARNAKENSAVVQQNGGSTRTGVLDWSAPTSCVLFNEGAVDLQDVCATLVTKFPLILAADSLYSPEHPRLLVSAVEAWLSEGFDARVIVEFPYREAYLPELSDFRKRMANAGLHILDEGEEKGYDDWGSEKNEDALVTCWWSCWGRKA
ncbi:hypothetical protein CC80DRAFT_119323 [Byssothecium circinans]|uniref:Uncharacterized protein n=1 Tax=Byssothecium circinans TaxID=147558 RepID=A0A6A5TZX7_9PLEO|nr:hypothetical protein CC80DRAFT_119323 [Byssothecium circinans]